MEEVHMSYLRASILERLDLWCAITGTAPSTLGRAAVGSGNAVARLRTGREVNLGTVERLLAFTEANPIGVP